MILSILIPTTIDRRAMFQKLREELVKQIYACKYPYLVEILHEEDNREISVGAKRQNLISKAKGRYVVHIDSDDWPSNQYVASILKATEERPDCIGFMIACDMEGKHVMASASNKYEDWREDVDGFKYVRTIYHKTPVLREHALKIGFKDMRFREDYDFSKRLKESGLLKKEVYINDVLYHYRYKYQDPKIKYGL